MAAVNYRATEDALNTTDIILFFKYVSFSFSFLRKKEICVFLVVFYSILFFEIVFNFFAHNDKFMYTCERVQEKGYYTV